MDVILLVFGKNRGCGKSRAKSASKCPFFQAAIRFPAKLRVWSRFDFWFVFENRMNLLKKFTKGGSVATRQFSASQTVLNGGKLDLKRCWNFPPRRLRIPCFRADFLIKSKSYFWGFHPFFWWMFANPPTGKFPKNWLPTTAFFDGIPTSFFEEKLGFGRLFVISSAVQ